MIVVSDTSPISNLLLINRLDILQKVFGEIIIPEAVYNEVLALKSFDRNIVDFENAAWIKRVAVTDLNIYYGLKSKLDDGEAQAITLAQELHPDFLLIDEKKGRAVALELGIKIIGLVGVLVKAKREKHIEFLKPILDDLMEIEFWINEKLYKEVLISVNEQ
jgi:uncharacterized protein